MWTGLPRLTVIFLLIIAQCFAVSALAGAKISIEGGEKDLQQNILAHIGEIDKQELSALEPLEKKVQAAFRKASRALGYYQATAQVLMNDKSVSLLVTPGKAVSFSRPEIIIDGPGANLPELVSLVQSPTIKAGERLIHEKYDSLKKSLLQKLLLHGYLDAEYLKTELRLDLKTFSAEAYLHLRTGPRYTVGNVKFIGSQLNQDLLNRLSPLQEDTYVNNDDILLLRRNLQDSKYFSSVSLKQRRQTNHSLDIDVMLVDTKKHQFEVGVGFSTDTGPRVRFSWYQPQLNKAGHNAEIALQLSQVEQEVSARYMIPLAEPLTHFLQFDAGWQKKELQDTLSEQSTVGMFITDHIFSKWRMDYGINLNYEEYIQGSQSVTDTLYFMPGIAFSKTFLPRGIDPLSGWRFWTKLSGSNGALGADTGFLRIHGQSKRIFNLGNDNTLLIARLELGAISTNNISKIPASLRFFTGGDQTVRGYKYESLAPEDAQGELIGGRYLNVASVELSHRIFDHWRAAVFADSGRAYNDSNSDFSTGIGTGIRWLSPIGQIRFDVAFPLQETNSDFQIHISMGPAL